MKSLGVSKKAQRWAETKIKSDSDWAIETQRRLRELVNWNHVDLNINTSGEVLNCVHTAVGNGLDHWWEFMRWQIPVGMTARIVMNSVMRFKIYAAGGAELGRNVELMLGMQKVGKAMPTEITRLKYSTWYDWTWLEMLNRDARDSLIIDLSPAFEVLLWEGERLALYVKNSTIDLPAAPHASTLIAYPCQTITNADLARQIDKIKKQIMAERGIDVAD